MAKKSELTFIFKGCQVGEIWYPAEIYPLDRLPDEIKAALEQGWIDGYFKKVEQHSELNKFFDCFSNKKPST